MQLFQNEQPRRKGFPQEEKGQKRICIQRHRISNLRKTIYLQRYQTKNMTEINLMQIPVQHNTW